MISLDQVNLLEQKVESAVAKIQQLQAENDALRLEVSKLTNALSSKSEQLTSFESDQNQIESGIRKALDRLNFIENSLLKTVGQGASPVTNPVQVPVTTKPAPSAGNNTNNPSTPDKPVQPQGTAKTDPSFMTMQIIDSETKADSSAATRTTQTTGTNISNNPKNITSVSEQELEETINIFDDQEDTEEYEDYSQEPDISIPLSSASNGQSAENDSPVQLRQNSFFNTNNDVNQSGPASFATNNESLNSNLNLNSIEEESAFESDESENSDDLGFDIF